MTVIGVVLTKNVLNKYYTVIFHDVLFLFSAKNYWVHREDSESWPQVCVIRYKFH